MRSPTTWLHCHFDCCKRLSRQRTSESATSCWRDFVTHPEGPRKTFLLTIVVERYILLAVAQVVARQLKQTAPFDSLEQEVLLGLRMAANRALDPWAQF